MLVAAADLFAMIRLGAVTVNLRHGFHFCRHGPGRFRMQAVAAKAGTILKGIRTLLEQLIAWNRPGTDDPIIGECLRSALRMIGTDPHPDILGLPTKRAVAAPSLGGLAG